MRKSWRSRADDFSCRRVAKYHIRLNAIAPGPFPTEGAWSRLMPSKQFEEHSRDKHPMKRFGTSRGADQPRGIFN